MDSTTTQRRYVCLQDPGAVDSLTPIPGGQRRRPTISANNRRTVANPRPSAEPWGRGCGNLKNTNLRDADIAVGFSFLPEDAQKFRIKRFLMAALSYALWVGLTFYCYQLGLVEVSARGFWIAAALTGVCNLAFYALFRSGLNLYWPDPSLTLPQMVVATTWVMLLMALAPKVRGILLLLYVVVFLFGVFRLRRGEYLGLTALVLVGYGFVVLRDMYLHSSVVPLPLEALQSVVLAATLLWLAFFGSYVGKLRETVSKRNAELGQLLAKNRRPRHPRRSHRHLQPPSHHADTGAGAAARPAHRPRLQPLPHGPGPFQARQRPLRPPRGRRAAAPVRGAGTGGSPHPGPGRARRRARGSQGGGNGEENFGRYGGEEFLLVMPETDLDGAHACVDRIRRKVAAEPFVLEGQAVKLTVSCGLAAHPAR